MDKQQVGREEEEKKKKEREKKKKKKCCSLTLLCVVCQQFKLPGSGERVLRADRAAVFRQHEEDGGFLRPGRLGEGRK